MTQEISDYASTIRQLETELDAILLAKNISILDLFHRIAIRYF
jgi:hypothetical protein